MIRLPESAPSLGRVFPGAAWAVLLLAAPGVGAGAEAAEKLRLGFTYAMFTGVNENDAKASIKALAATVARERGIPADPDPLLFTGAASAAEAVRAARVDAVTLSLGEYHAIRNEVAFDRFLFSHIREDPSEKYVVLIHRKRPNPTLAGLQGARIAFFSNPRMSLARVWLEVELARAGLPAAAAHFARVVENAKLSRVVLDTYFGQADACVVTERGLATMVELNPQVGKDLVGVATSGPLIPALFAFRADLAPWLKEKSLREFGVVHQSTAGQQAMMIFQSGRVAERPATVLDGSLALVDEYARVRPADYPAYLERVRGAKPAGEGRQP